MDKIYLRCGQKLFIYKTDADISEIKNFTFPVDSFTQIYENILCVIASDVMYNVYLDEIFNESVKIKRTEVFDRSFSVHSGLFQNTGGVNRFFYNTGKDLATVKTNLKIKQIQQSASVGMIQYIDNKIVENRYFHIKGLDFELNGEICEMIHDFAFIPSGKEKGFVAEPADNKILIRRIEDFQTVSELSCPVATQSSKMQYSNAGLLILEEKSVFLINQKNAK